MAALSRALAILLLVSFLLATIATVTRADDDDDEHEHVKYRQFKKQPPCSECYSECITSWREYTCHFKCFWCLPLNEPISGSDPSTGWQTAIQTTRNGVFTVTDTLGGAINGTKDLLHHVF
ncbi:uncharacterized protein LOC144573542 [Carex rostrata]